MKKIITVFLTAFLALSVFAGCKKADNVIRVNEVTDSFFYAPFYVAIEKGFFKDEGLEIELTNGGGSDVSMTALLSGGADVILAGPETAVYVSKQNKKDKPKVFAQLTKRDGCFLIGRKEEKDFKFSDLKGKTVIIGRKGGLPAMTFQYVVKNSGLTEGKDVTLRTDVQFPLMAPTFDGGAGDYVTLFEPTATEFVNAGKGYIVASVGKESGEIPYTSFIALESYMKKNGEKIEKFTRALMKAVKYTAETDDETVAEYLVKHFTGSVSESVAASLKNYKSVDTWQKDLVLTKTAYEKLLSVIKNAGENVNGAVYENIVETKFAQKIYKEIYGA